MHADLPRDVAWCRDADNISKVRAANVDLGCYNVTDTPPCSYRLFVPDGFSMQLPVVSEMQCTIPTSLLVFVGDVANKPRKVHNCTFSLIQVAIPISIAWRWGQLCNLYCGWYQILCQIALVHLQSKPQMIHESYMRNTTTIMHCNCQWNY